MSPETLMVARLKGEAWPIMVKWKGRNGRWRNTLCWTLKGTTHTLFLPRHVTSFDINFAGEDFTPKSRYRYEDQSWHCITEKGPWYPEKRGDRSRQDSSNDTWLYVHIGLGKRATYRRTEHYEQR